jgi:hypothetical protein
MLLFHASKALVIAAIKETTVRKRERETGGEGVGEGKETLKP